MMKNRTKYVALAIVVSVAMALLAKPSNGWAREKAEGIDEIIKQRVDQGFNVSIAVAVIDQKGTHYHCYGHPSKGNKKTVNKNTLYEIGSITKTFTTLLLADMVHRGEASLEDPIDKYLPAEVKTPTYHGKKIRLVDLATHTSGLPRAPTNMTTTGTKNPYADYTTDKLYAFLGSYKLTREVGSQFEYSNLGMGLLAHLLSLKTGQDYEKMAVSRICKPLGMKSTRIRLNRKLKRRLATGYNTGDLSENKFDMSVLEGAGDLRSSVKDLATYVKAHMGLKKTKLAAAIRLSHKIILPDQPLGGKTALGWLVAEEGGRQIIMHSGATFGFRSFIGFDKKHKQGIVVLTNSTQSIADIGFHYLNPEHPLRKMSKEIKVDKKLLDQYVGGYRLNGIPLFFEFKREGNSLVVFQEGAPKLTLYPESKTTFFYKTINAKFTFLKNDKGIVDRIILHQNGKEILGKRVPKEYLSKEIKIDPTILDAYVGEFRFGGNLRFKFVKEGHKLMVLQKGAPKLRVFPESETQFFYKTVDAQFTFIRDKNGRANEVILHQFGRDMHGKRVH